MRNKLLLTVTLLAIGIAVAACEKTPSEQPAASQNGSTAPERQQTESAQPEQPRVEKQGKQSEFLGRGTTAAFERDG